MIYYSIASDHSAGMRIDVDTWKFPSGEVGVNVNCANKVSLDVNSIDVSATLRNSDEVLSLIMTVDALKRAYPTAKLRRLNVPFIPYGRQDRVCNVGDSLSISVLCRLLENLKFDFVSTIVPHSNVTTALFDCIEAKELTDIIAFNKLNYAGYTVVAPDAGALKRANEFATLHGCSQVVVANKVRDMKTGVIKSYDFDYDVSGKSIVVIDDLIDGGGTFIALGECLKVQGASSVDLIVAHGIFTKGVDVVAHYYDKIITTNSYHYDTINSDLNHPKVRVIDVW